MTTSSMLNHPGPLMDYRVVERYFVLGSEQGTFDAPAPDIREVPTPTLDHWLAHDGVRVVQDAAAYLTAGRVHRADPAIHALARAIVAGPAAARAQALAALPGALKTSSQLFALLRFIRGRTPWHPALRDALGAWYTSRTTSELAALVVHTPAVGAWNHREAFALARPTAPTDGHEAFFRWLVEGKLGLKPPADPGLGLVAAFTRLQETPSPSVARDILEQWPGLRDSLPPAWFQDARSVEWLVSTLSGEGLVAWVKRLAAHGALGADNPGATALARRLAALAPVERAGLEPFAVLAAWATVRFQQARGLTPPPGLQSTLYTLFHDRLATTPRAAGSLVIAVDPAASTALDGLPACLGLDPRTALAALTLLALASVEQVTLWGYGRELEPLAIDRGDDLQALLAKLDKVRAGTVDGSAPIEQAYGGDHAVSTFLVLGGTRPAARAFTPEDVLARYRRAAGVPARWIGVSLGQHRLAPRAPRSLDALEIHGFDDAVPALLGDLLHASQR